MLLGPELCFMCLKSSVSFFRLEFCNVRLSIYCIVNACPLFSACNFPFDFRWGVSPLQYCFWIIKFFYLHIPVP